jgi:MoaA/NifB/PqqE/SkfB family radical SAM enzyme
VNLSFQSILVSLTEECHVGCGHCGFVGADRERSMAPGEVQEWVSDCAAYGIPQITFTGGEPFERIDLLSIGVGAAYRSSSCAVASFTSSFWATSRDEARKVLGGLRGLSHLYLSTDTYHQKRVPYQNVMNVIDVAPEFGILHITLCITYASDSDRQLVREKYSAYGDRVKIYEERVIPTRYIQKALRSQDSLKSSDSFSEQTQCWIDTPIINPNGDFFACHVGKAGAHSSMRGSPYWLGNLREKTFSEIVEDAGLRLDYQYLRTHGPAGISALIEHQPSLLAKVGKKGFSGICDMCFSILSNPDGQEALNRFVRKPEIRAAINARLSICRGEPPIPQLPAHPAGKKRTIPIREIEGRDSKHTVPDRSGH